MPLRGRGERKTFHAFRVGGLRRAAGLPGGETPSPRWGEEDCGGVRVWPVAAPKQRAKGGGARAAEA